MPIVFILLVTIADFARVFAAGIVVEGAARNAAEVVAQAYLAEPPGPLDSAAPAPADPAYYAALHDKGARVVCAAGRDLPGSDFTGGVCPTWPNVRVCIHDDALDNGCGDPIAGFAQTAPTECSEINSPWSAASDGGATSRRYVEVRVCQRFDLFLDLPFLPFNDMHLQRSRTFVIPCYFSLGMADCG